jgi:hypothetical protein
MSKKNSETRTESLVYPSMLGLSVGIFFPGKFDLNISAFKTLILKLQRTVIFGGWPLFGKERIVH